MQIKGVIIKSTGSNYWVKTPENLVEAKLPGKFRLEDNKATNPIAVGDLVELTQDNQQWLIQNIEPRKNYLIRKSTNLSKQHHIIAANVDLILIVATLKQPYTTYEFINRITLTAEAYDIDYAIVLNKTDLLTKAKDTWLREEFIETYQKANIPVIEASVKTNSGIDKIKIIIKNNTVLLSGNSGVGKSSLIKQIDPNINLKISQVSDAHKTGKHTTTFAEMFSLSLPAKVIDTPGLRAFGLVDIDKENLSHYFREFKSLLGMCKFKNCQHINEPGCAVIQQVEENKIAQSRYKSYLNIYYETHQTYR